MIRERAGFGFFVAFDPEGREWRPRRRRTGRSPEYGRATER
jgi:hypothetical protein